jgi:hypothetical protein
MRPPSCPTSTYFSRPPEPCRRPALSRHPETAAAITRVLQIVRIDVAMLLLVVVVDMVVKPFG